MQLCRAGSLLGVSLLLLGACADPRPTEAVARTAAAVAAAADRTPADAPATRMVVASGLRYPRGLTIEQSGAIVVAEAGTQTGHTLSTAGLCQQRPAPPGPGPALGGFTGRISTIVDGVRETAASGLPSAYIVAQHHASASPTWRSSARRCTRCSTVAAATACSARRRASFASSAVGRGRSSPT